MHTPAITAAGPAHPPVLAIIHAAGFSPEEAWNATLIAAHLSMPGVFALLCGTQGMIMARVAADEAEILTLAVAATARRRGLGAALLGAAEMRARLEGAANMFLEVAESNAAARALYAAAGYATVGHRRRYYEDGTNALVLAKPLN